MWGGTPLLSRPKTQERGNRGGCEFRGRSQLGAPHTLTEGGHLAENGMVRGGGGGGAERSGAKACPKTAV